jgi:signal transduction histidine kinase
MRDILSDLTMLTNADSLTETIMMEEVELGQVVEAVVKSLRVLADQKKIKLSYKQNTRNYHILGDEAKLEKMLLNIVRNALKYTDPKGAVQVWTEADKKEVRIMVEDNGIGIPEEDLPFIFERFYRVDKARARAEGGTGLGLSICKWIAEGHGGSITVSSIVNKGTVFTIHLPINRENNLSTVDQK